MRVQSIKVEKFWNGTEQMYNVDIFREKRSFLPLKGLPCGLLSDMNGNRVYKTKY